MHRGNRIAGNHKHVYQLIFQGRVQGITCMRYRKIKAESAIVKTP
jgi:hypothetical protein